MEPRMAFTSAVVKDFVERCTRERREKRRDENRYSE
jgi:hypothetical protein